MPTRVRLANAFTISGQGGNPGGVVVDATGLSKDQMQAMARQVGVSETAFVGPAGPGWDHDVRFFTPTREVALCGHGTIATYAVLYAEGRLGPGTWRMRTPAGIQTVQVRGDGTVCMTQNLPAFSPGPPAEAIAPALGIDPADLVPPLGVVSTGLPKIHCGVRSLASLEAMTPDYGAIAALAPDGTGVFAHARTDGDVTARCRNFSTAVGGEDPATGTACAGLSCLLVHHGLVNAGTFVFEQGFSVGRPSEILVEVEAERGVITAVRVLGKATVTEERTLG